MMKIIIISVLIGVSLGSDVNYDVYQERLDCPGQDQIIEEGTYDTILKCMQRCDHLDNCVAILRDSITQTCVFKNKCGVSSLQRTSCPCTLYVKTTRVYEVELDTNCPGNEIKPVEASDVASCIRACDDTSDCVGFFRSSKKCSLKKTCTDKENSDDGNLYLNDLGKFQYLPRAKCESENMVLPSTVKSPGECIKKCVGKPGCVAVVYDMKRSDTQCMLKETCGNFSQLAITDYDVYLSPESGLLAAPTSVDCESAGGQCRARKCEEGEKKCPPKCGTGKGKVCCCKVKDKKQCRAEGGSCRHVTLQCETNEVPCGPCEKGTARRCCCKRVDPTPGRVVTVTDD